MGKRKNKKPKEVNISVKPEVLYYASYDRLDEAATALNKKHWILSMYLSGLAVECVLQALAIRAGAEPDARHDLIRWLAKCPEKLKTAIHPRVREHWSSVCVMWDNRLRYFSYSGGIGYLKRKGLHRNPDGTYIRGDHDSILKANARSLLASAKAVHEKGIVIRKKS